MELLEQCHSSFILFFFLTSHLTSRSFPDRLWWISIEHSSAIQKGIKHAISVIHLCTCAFCLCTLYCRCEMLSHFRDTIQVIGRTRGRGISIDTNICDQLRIDFIAALLLFGVWQSPVYSSGLHRHYLLLHFHRPLGLFHSARSIPSNDWK